MTWCASLASSERRTVRAGRRSNEKQCFGSGPKKAGLEIQRLPKHQVEARGETSDGDEFMRGPYRWPVSGCAPAGGDRQSVAAEKVSVSSRHPPPPITLARYMLLLQS
jgi:hypothetical protein